MKVRTTCLWMLIHYVLSGKSFQEKPNIVIFLADDMGYGDLQHFGNPLSRTPNINYLTDNGLKLTQFYSAAPMCSPARAGLLTGRYPVRSGVWNSYPGSGSIFMQVMTDGLPHKEITIPEMLAKQDYKSALIGKWQLGVGRERQFLPTQHGFDFFFGIPNSHMDCPCISKCFYPHDECNADHCRNDVAPCQLMLNDVIIEQPLNLLDIAARQARAARSFIQEKACTRTPFFLLYSFLHPHIPHFAGKLSRNSTLGGDYTDSLAELDWQVGEVMEELKNNGAIDNTLVIFTSDNGPALPYLELGGFSGAMKCGKHSTFEGGTRVPTIAYWKGRIPSGISTEFLSHLDIWPTLRSLSGSAPDDFDVILDGFDFSNTLFKNEESPRSSMLYYPDYPDPAIGPYAVRNKRYKAHFVTNCGKSCKYLGLSDEYCEMTFYDPPLLYDLLLDPEERNNRNGLPESKQILLEMTLLLESYKVDFAKSILQATDPRSQLCCNPGCESFPSCCQCPSNYTKEMFPLKKECDLSPLDFRGKKYKQSCVGRH
ncbi:arylsulfatase A-like [Anneissia japonica]|uniref:arylsulfatase A-like n=1 Tax=Anneissia japonica TaxID=1529436 RepID=UPI0014256D68|nr:arylsulfatase A-like [Anneissia japonica]